MNNIDNKLKDLFNKEDEIPASVKEKITLAYEDIRLDSKSKAKKKIKFNKKIAIAAALIFAILIPSSIQVKALVDKYLLSSDNKGMEKALDNNYVQKVSDSKISLKDMDFEITDVLKDSTKIAIAYTINIKDKNLISKLKTIEKINTYFSIYDLNNKAILEDGNVNTIIGGFGDGKVDKSNLDKGILKCSFIATNADGNIPNINGLKLKLNTLRFVEKNEDIKLLERKNLGSFEIKLDDKFTKAPVINYKVVEPNNKVEIISAQSNPTGVLVKFIVKVPVDENILLNSHVVTTDGKSYSGHHATMDTLDNNSVLSIPFEGITSFDNIDEFSLVIDDLDGKTETIKFKK